MGYVQVLYLLSLIPAPFLIFHLPTQESILSYISNPAWFQQVNRLMLHMGSQYYPYRPDTNAPLLKYEFSHSYLESQTP